MALIKGYIGGAGTGKTTQLIKELIEYVKIVQWNKNNSVLALTFMHGSRKRLNDKLSFLQKIKVPYKCLTIDSFATNIVERFRRFIGIIKTITVVPENDDAEMKESERTLYVTWNYIRKCFIQLLSFKVVRDFISISYPIIIIDEFHDCENDLLDIVRNLAHCEAVVLIAGDDFQQLNDSETCSATEWLKENCKIQELLHIHRTKESTILSSAFGLRNNMTIQNGLQVKAVSSPQFAAWHISALIQWYSWGRNDRNVVLLYPVSPEKSPFVREALKRLQAPFLKQKTPLEPYPFKFENNHIHSASNIFKKLFSTNVLPTISRLLLEELLKNDNIIIKKCSQRALKLLSLRGDGELQKSEFSILINKECHLHKSFYGASKKVNQVAMTIHSAKNREFDYVIVLWPYEVHNQEVYKMKMLYNAITRAKRNAIIIVQSKNEASFKKDKVLTLFDKVDFWESRERSKTKK